MTKPASDSSYHPKLRWPLDIRQMVHQGQELISLHCPYGIAPEPAILPLACLSLLQNLDGQTSIETLLSRFTEQGLSAAILEGILQKLDQMLFLDSAETRSRLERVFLEYSSLKEREAAHAGYVYPEDPDQMQAQIQTWLGMASKSKSQEALQSGQVWLAPHIDYARGWESYASLFNNFCLPEGPSVIFLFGTSHQYGESLFRLTKKDFVIPGNIFTVDTELVSQIAEVYGEERSFCDEYVHKTEHSIELLLPFLGQALGWKDIPKIVPILVGSMHEFVSDLRDSASDLELGSFISALKLVVRDLQDRNINPVFLAGLDMAHVGQAFGDSEKFSQPDRLLEVESRDREYIRISERGNSSELLKHIAEDSDARRVCGYPSLYTIFRLYEELQLNLSGQLCSYHQAVDEQSDTVVSFCGMSWAVSG